MTMTKTCRTICSKCWHNVDLNQDGSFDNILCDCCIVLLKPSSGHNTMLDNILYNIFQYAHIEFKSTLDFVHKDNVKFIFDYIIPEYRLAIDFVTDSQIIPLMSDISAYYTQATPAIKKRIEFDNLKDSLTRENNYRYMQINTSNLNPNEIRNKILDCINEVYIKATDCAQQLLEPRLQGDAGWDLVCDKDTMCGAGCGVDIPSQVYIELPNHIFAVVQARSSTSKKRLIVLPGVIDPAYRGQIFTMVFNPTDTDVMINRGDRLSQLLFFHRMVNLHVNPVLSLRKSERLDKGFGSTGQNVYEFIK